MERWWERLARLFRSGKPSELSAKVEKIDEHHREVRHDLRNIRAHTDYLRSLVLAMRDEGDRKETRR